MKMILAYGLPLQSEIERLINDKRKGLGEHAGWQGDFLRRLLPYASSGKLLRGSLLCFSFQAFTGQKPDRQVVDTAVALELIHSGLLMHDDVMDNDELRRGKPAMHIQYAKVGHRKKLKQPDTFGVNMAISGADLCLFMAIGMLPAAQPALGKLFAEILPEVCDGQMRDVYYQSAAHGLSKPEIYDLMRSKTASYTLSLPLTAGAIMASQPKRVTDKLRRLGDAAGMIFQIRDDELGILGNPRETGKPVGADIREDKKTLIHYYLMKKCDEPERQKLRMIFGNPDISPDDIAYVRKLISRRGISELLDGEVQRLRRKALDALGEIGLPRKYKAETESLISFCASRRA